MKAVEKVLTGCVNKVLDKFKRSSRASPDSEDEFQSLVKKPKTKPNAARYICFCQYCLYTVTTV